MRVGEERDTTGATQRPTCFISYARGDDEPFVERLRDTLAAEPYHVQVWWDRTAMQSRGVSFLQEIDEALQRVDRVVLVCGPAGARSRYVQHELVVARQSCRVVIPVLRRGGRENVPGWLSAHHSFDLREEDPRELAGLARAVSQPPDPLAPVPPGLPPVPARLVVTDATAEVVRLLLPAVVSEVRPAGDAVGVRLTGLPGIGKTITAGLVARDCDVRRSCPGGIHFLRVGADADAASVVAALRRGLGARPVPGETHADAIASLTDALAGSRRLVVLDDVWRTDQLDDVWAALVGGPHRLLVTSRFTELGADLSLAGVGMPLWPADDALSFMARRLDVTTASLPGEAAEVVELCGRLPLSLALCVAQAARGVSWPDLAAALTAADPGVLGDAPSGYEHPGVRAALQVSLDRLALEDPQLAEGYRELALFRRGRPVPARVVERLWGATDDAGRRAVRRGLATLGAWSLLVQDRETGDVVFHDLHWHSLRASGTDTRALADRLLTAFGRDLDSLLAAASDDEWFRAELLSLFAAGGRSADADALLERTGADGGHAWADLRGRHGELDGLWEDLQGWSAVDGTPREQVRRWVRATLMRCSIRATSWRVPGRLALVAARSGLWSVQQAMDVIARNPYERERLPARLGMLEVLPPQRRTVVLGEALAELPTLRSGSEVTARLEPVLTWGPAAGLGVDACLDALSTASPSALSPAVFTLVASHLAAGNDQRELAESAASRSVDPLAAAAALTRADPPGKALHRLKDLCAQADLAGRAAILAAAWRHDMPSLTQDADRLARSLIEGGTAGGIALRRLLPVVSDSCLGDLVASAEAHGGLSTVTFTSPIELYRLLRQRVVGEGGVRGLRRAASRLDPSYLGLGLLARVAALDHSVAGFRASTARVAEVVARLESELSPDGLADISDDVALLWPSLPDDLHSSLVDATCGVTNTHNRARALASFLPRLPASQSRAVLDVELARLANQASGIDLDGALAALADHLDARQVRRALAIATAARDDGFERAGLQWLVDELPEQQRSTAIGWTVGGAVRRLQQEGLAHPDELTELLETLVGLEVPLPSEVDGHELADVVQALQSAELRARALAALAARSPELWPRAEAALAEVDNAPGRLLVLSAWPRFATDERQARYVTRALELLPDADTQDRARAIHALRPFADVTAHADQLVKNEYSYRLRHHLPRVAGALSLAVITKVAQLHHDDLDGPSAAAVALRLVELGADSAAKTFLDRLGDGRRQDGLAGCVPLLNIEEIRRELDHGPTPSARRLLLAELARHGHVDEALGAVEELTGVQHLHALAVIAGAVPTARPAARLVAARLDLLAGADYDSLGRCVRAVVPVLLDLPAEERRQACRHLLDLLSQWPRLQALLPLYAATPLIAAVGGPDAAADTFHAVQDVMRWWPSVARSDRSGA